MRSLSRKSRRKNGSTSEVCEGPPKFRKTIPKGPLSKISHRFAGPDLSQIFSTFSRAKLRRFADTASSLESWFLPKQKTVQKTMLSSSSAARFSESGSGTAPSAIRNYLAGRERRRVDEIVCRFVLESLTAVGALTRFVRHGCEQGRVSHLSYK